MMLHSPVFGPGDLTSPYLVAMAHQEWRTQQVLKKHWRNRPLGRIHDFHRYKPPQPVLSCRTIDVDLNGTRTYRARTADDIIEEQHKVIHNIYSTARNVSSAPNRRSTPTPQRSTSALRALTVQGSRPGSTTPSYSRSKQNSAAEILRQSRPKTSAARSRPPQSPRSDGFMRVDIVDKDLQSSSNAYKDLQSQIRDRWDNPDNHALDEGQFVRGKKKDTTSSLDAKTGNQWLKFGGGQSDKETAGVTEAFAGSRSADGHQYTIDGTAGSQVARQLQPGEKIRVGVNGNEVGNTTDIRHWVQEQRDYTSTSSSTVPLNTGLADEEERVAMVPLCWTDQVHRNEVKVIQAKTSRADKDKPNLCESKPVYYHKTSTEDADNSARSTPSRANEGYTVKVRTKPRKGMDGLERSTSRITSISIDNNPGNMDDVLLSYEDILDINVKTQKSSSKAINNSDPKTTAAAIKVSQGVEAKPAVVKSGEVSSSLLASNKEVEVSKIMSKDPAPSPSLFENSRPVTAMSRISLESDIDLVVAPGTSRSNLSTPMSKASVGHVRQGVGSRGSRTTSAGRPPPQKPSLHKTTAAVGASIQSGSTGKVAETEYIHFTQQLIASQDLETPKRNANGTSSSSAAAIQSISNHNLPEDDEKTDSPPFSPQQVPSTPSGGSLMSPRALSEDGGGAQTPPTSPRGERDNAHREEEEVRYAFNIPTAGIVESEIDPGELHPVLEEGKEED